MIGGDDAPERGEERGEDEEGVTTELEALQAPGVEASWPGNVTRGTAIRTAVGYCIELKDDADESIDAEESEPFAKILSEGRYWGSSSGSSESSFSFWCFVL
jgi:hypothetical protein